MDFTGERMIPEHNQDSEIYLEHMTRYLFASQLVNNKVVLDIACGSGYGSELLANAGAQEVVGVDISEETIAYCKERYQKNNLNFICGSVESIPLPDMSVDLVVSFETIEHVDEKAQKNFLREIKRVLKLEGIFIVSTPNTLVSPPGNPFHINELTADDFHGVLKEKFSFVNFWYQKNIEASFLMTKEQLRDPSSAQSLDLHRLLEEKAEEAYFIVAVCSNSEFLPKDIKSRIDVFGDQERLKMLAERDHLICNSDKNIFERDTLIKKNEQMILERDACIATLQRRIQSIESSFVWWLTQPLRLILRFVRKMTSD